jgi:hypothetical protein
MISDVLLVAALVLFVLKFGLAKGVLGRLKEIGRIVDGLVNVLLVVLLVAYGVQLAYFFFTHRGP